MNRAIASTRTHTPAAVLAVIKNWSWGSPPNWESMAVSREKMDTMAVVRLTALAAESTGLWNFRYFTTLMMAMVRL